MTWGPADEAKHPRDAAGQWAEKLSARIGQRLGVGELYSDSDYSLGEEKDGRIPVIYRQHRGMENATITRVGNVFELELGRRSIELDATDLESAAAEAIPMVVRHGNIRKVQRALGDDEHQSYSARGSQVTAGFRLSTDPDGNVVVQHINAPRGGETEDSRRRAVARSRVYLSDLIARGFAVRRNPDGSVTVFNRGPR